MVSYGKLNGICNKHIHCDQEKFVQNKADEIKKAARNKDISSLFKHLQDLTDGKAPREGPVVSRDVTLLLDESLGLNR